MTLTERIESIKRMDRLADERARAEECAMCGQSARDCPRFVRREVLHPSWVR